MNKYKLYASLKKQQKELEQQIIILQDDLFNDLSEIDGNKLKTKYGTFSIMYRKQYSYSEELTKKVNKIKDRIKLLKKEEEASGKAILLKEKGYIRLQTSE